MSNKTLCALRDLTVALEIYEKDFQAANQLSLKEAMVLCCVSDQQNTASEIAGKIEMTNSNCSKVIRSVEEKGLVKRAFGAKDKRHMFFSLTSSGLKQLDKIRENDVPLPDILKRIIEF